MQIEQMRDILKKQYGGAPKWVSKVKAMKDGQVLAIYSRMLHSHTLKN